MDDKEPPLRIVVADDHALVRGGIGVLNIRTIFGETAVRPRKLLKLLVHLEDHGHEAFSDLDADVRQSIARIHASPFIPHKESVRGFVYEVETGRLREVT